MSFHMVITTKTDGTTKYEIRDEHSLIITAHDSEADAWAVLDGLNTGELVLEDLERL